MSINLDGLSAKELATLISQANQRKKKLNKRKPAVAVRKKIAALLKAEGYTHAELFGARPAATAPKAGKPKGPKPGGKVAPKYRNPTNSSQTWAARGKQPLWLAAEIAKGRKLEEFAIK